MSERASERMSAADRASEASSAEQANERTSEWPSPLRVDFIVILPTVTFMIGATRTGWNPGGSDILLRNHLVSDFVHQMLPDHHCQVRQLT